jgi:hypothetical protein
MSFDPNLPQTNSPVASAELRDQFNALKELIDERPTVEQMTLNSASNIDAMAPLPTDFHNPPTFEDLVTITFKINRLQR